MRFVNTHAALPHQAPSLSELFYSSLAGMVFSFISGILAHDRSAVLGNKVCKPPPKARE